MPRRGRRQGRCRLPRHLWAAPLVVPALFIFALTEKAAASGSPLSPLHVSHQGSPAIVDAGGRQVLLRGANTSQLGDYYRVSPDLRPTEPLRKVDFQRMSQLGFDVVRVVLSWSKLEPHRGQL